MNTRFHDDPARIEQQLRQQTYAGRYAITLPNTVLYSDDTQLRMQKWGGNLRTQTVNLESDLKGMTRSLTRDNVTYQSTAVSSTLPSYATADPQVRESRAEVPAWQFRDAEQSRWESPWINPQAHLEKPFHDNLPTRMLEKDHFRPELSTQVPCDPRDNVAKTSEAIDYYLSGRSLCLG